VSRQFILVAASVALLSACSSQSARSTTAAGGGRGTPVRAASVTIQAVPLDIRAIGNVEAYSSVAIKSRVAGQLVRVHVRDGGDVQKGELLFEIDALPFEEQLRQAEANLARNRALEKQAEAGIARSRSQARQAQAQAERYAKLLKEGITSSEQADQFRAAAEAADAGLNADISALESARAAIRADEARVSEAKLQLSYTKVYAPISGRAGAVLIKEGNLVKDNDTTALVNILQVNPVYVSFAVPEKWLEQVRNRMRIRRLQVLAAGEGSDAAPESGILEFIDNTVDTSTGTIRMKATFPNRNLTLWPGQFANVTMTLDVQRNAVTVPVQAVQNRQEGQYVWIVKPDMTAELRPVRVARTHGDTAVVSDGVQAGESVITEGQLRVTPGAALVLMKSATRAGLSAEQAQP
jgi:multidrug efflux system membrane fusion protein